MTNPQAQLQVVLGSGSPQTGAITTTTGTQITLSGASTIGWRQQLYQIFGPPGFTVPAGWSTDPVTTCFLYASGMNPPPFTASVWGKYLFRLIVNNGLNADGQLDPTLTDTSTALTILSPSLGLADLGWLEGNQFNATHLWQGDQAANLRLIDTLAGMTAPALSSSTPAAVSTTGAVGSALTAARGDHVHALTFATVQTLLGGASSAVGLNAQGLTGLGDVSFAASFPSPTVSQAQLGSTGGTPGQTLTILGQQGQDESGTNANTNGGNVAVTGGAPGTGGSGAAGSQGNVTATGSTVTLAGSTGIALAGGQITLTGSGLSLSGAPLDSALLFRSDQTPAIAQSTLSGTGATAGALMTVSAQTGQSQTGSAANNNGGDLLLAAGDAGTGGSGAPGLQGDVTLQGDEVILGATTQCTLQANGGSLTWTGTALAAGSSLTIAATTIAVSSTDLGFFGATPVPQPTRAGQLTDSTTGSLGTALVDGGAMYSQTITNDNNATILNRLNAIDLLLHKLGLST